jgi:hypothetical protein
LGYSGLPRRCAPRSDGGRGAESVGEGHVLSRSRSMPRLFRHGEEPQATRPSTPDLSARVLRTRVGEDGRKVGRVDCQVAALLAVTKDAAFN